jgi:uncharacterized membrane protein
MKALTIALQRETAVPVIALMIASIVSGGLVLARIAWTGQIRYGLLVWNLFLAWLPLIFALLAREHYRKGTRRSANLEKPTPGPSKEGSIVGRALARFPLPGAVRGGLRDRNWRFAGLAAAWLLFFPNAPYIFTDVVHLANRYFAHFWVDLMLILLCALTGLVLGFVSLYLMQSVVSRMFGRVASWLFIAGVASLSSFGVYLGRFVRVNSWDIVTRPVKLYHGINEWASDPFAHATSFAFPILFAAFLFIAYVMLYALTHLPQVNQLATPLEGRTEA